tara:strand:- start:17794 stop:19287 length:1494 start_codon:yes stop_codon:yes gene_type:complete
MRRDSLPYRHLINCTGILVVFYLLGVTVFGNSENKLLFQAQESPNRSRPPELGPAPSLKLPQIHIRTLLNGLQIRIVETHEVPLVQINVLVTTGSGDEPASQMGIANLTAAMLDEGAGNRSALEISDAVEFLGAMLQTRSSFDASSVQLNVPTARLTEALPILADVVLRPTFPKQELDRLKNLRLTALLQARDNAGAIATAAFNRTLFGRRHRYGTGTTGTETSLEALTVKNLREFHASHYLPSTSTIIVVGDVSPDTILPQLAHSFGAWKSKARVRTVPSKRRALSEREVVLVDKPGAAQSQIRIGWVGVPRSTSDYFTLEVLNTVLGGSFTSRLNLNLRETHGYTYGAWSTFEMRLGPGPFIAGASVQTDKTAEALQEFFLELDAIRQPIGLKELAKAKNYLSLGFPKRFETIANTSRRVEELIIYSLPEDYFQDYMLRVQEVTADAVNKASLQYMSPLHSAVVIVGDLKIIEPKIRALKLGSIRHMSLDEAFGH